MRHWTLWFLLAASVAAPAAGQTKKPKSSIAKIAAKLADTALTGVAAGLVDSALGTAAVGSQCPAGTVAMAAGGASGLIPAGAASPGAAIVQAARQKLSKEKPETAVTAAAPQVYCVTPAQAQAAASQQAAGQVPSAGSMATGVLSATPVGMLATGAVAAAPVAGKAVKAIGGLFGHKGASKEGMIKDLAKGRLVLKGVKFLPGSDALEDGFEDDLLALAEALSSMSGEWVLNVPAEADGKEAPDTTMARRRLDKLIVHLQVAGVSPERLTVAGIYPPELNPEKKAPKPGKVQVEVIRLPKDFKP